MLSLTCTNFVLLLNNKENILKNVSNQTVDGNNRLYAQLHYFLNLSQLPCFLSSIIGQA